MLEDEVKELQQPLLDLLSPFILQYSTIGLNLEVAKSFSSLPDLIGSMQGQDVLLSKEKLDVRGNSLAQLMVRMKLSKPLTGISMELGIVLLTRKSPSWLTFSAMPRNAISWPLSRVWLRTKIRLTAAVACRPWLWRLWGLPAGFWAGHGQEQASV